MAVLTKKDVQELIKSKRVNREEKNQKKAYVYCRGCGGMIMLGEEGIDCSVNDQGGVTFWHEACFSLVWK